MKETAKRAALATLVVGGIVIAALALWKLKLVLALLFFAFIIAAAMRVGCANFVSGSGGADGTAPVCSSSRRGERRRKVSEPVIPDGGSPVLMSFLYVALRRVLELIGLCFRTTEFKELEIIVLRHELEVLRRQVARPKLRPADRAFLAAASRVLPRSSTRSFFVRPETVLEWHRRLVARRWTYERKRLGRPPIPAETRELILRLARENQRWGYQRIVGELSRLEVTVSATTVRKAAPS